MNRIFPFILVDDAKKAIEVYIKAFHAALLGDITYYKEWDDQAPYPDKIVHAALRIEDSQMFIADATNEREDQQERGWGPYNRHTYEHGISMNGALYVGDPQYVARKINHLKHALGIQRFTLHIPVGPMPHENIMQTIRLLGEEVRKYL